jgi:hypothetical protein
MVHWISALIVWAVALVVAWPYVARIRHPASKPVAAYLIFVIVLSAAALVVFALLWELALALGIVRSLGSPLWAVPFLILVFLPAFLMASWQARKPPRRSPRLR